MIMPHVSNKTGICAQASMPSLSCSLEWLRFRSFPVWCKTLKNNEFRTKKFPNQEFLYGISSFCTLSENNSFLHVKISCFCIFLAKNGVFNTNRTPRAVYDSPPQWATLFIRLSAKDAANLISYRGVRRITAKIRTVICEQAPNHGSYFAYARLIARVNSQST